MKTINIKTTIMMLLLAACQPVASDEPTVSARSEQPEDETPEPIEQQPWGLISPVRLVIQDDETVNVFKDLAVNEFCLPQSKTSAYGDGFEALITGQYTHNGYNKISVALDINYSSVTAYRLEMIKTAEDYLALQGMTRNDHYELDIATVGGALSLIVTILDDELSYGDECNDTYNPLN